MDSLNSVRAYEEWEDYHGGTPVDAESIIQKLMQETPVKSYEEAENIVMGAYIAVEEDRQSAAGGGRRIWNIFGPDGIFETQQFLPTEY